jgi:hypothetical protein
MLVPLTFESCSNIGKAYYQKSLLAHAQGLQMLDPVKADETRNHFSVSSFDARGAKSLYIAISSFLQVNYQVILRLVGEGKVVIYGNHFSLEAASASLLLVSTFST